MAFYCAGLFILISGFLSYVTAILLDREALAEKEKERDAERQLNLRNGKELTST